MQVICNKAKQVDRCEGCFHNEPHDEIELQSEKLCTESGPCFGTDCEKEITVKCIPYHGDDNDQS